MSTVVNDAHFDLWRPRLCQQSGPLFWHWRILIPQTSSATVAFCWTRRIKKTRNRVLLEVSFGGARLLG